MDVGGEEQNAVNKYPVGADVTLWCVKIFVGYYKRGPFLFYHLTAELSSVSAA